MRDRGAHQLDASHGHASCILNPNLCEPYVFVHFPLPRGAAPPLPATVQLVNIVNTTISFLISLPIN